nr:hypothetical protein CFP56_18208 [Quercus suber]
MHHNHVVVYYTTYPGYANTASCEMPRMTKLLLDSEGLFGVFSTKNLPSEPSIQNWMLIELLGIIGGID